MDRYRFIKAEHGSCWLGINDVRPVDNAECVNANQNAEVLDKV